MPDPQIRGHEKCRVNGHPELLFDAVEESEQIDFSRLSGRVVVALEVVGARGHGDLPLDSRRVVRNDFPELLTVLLQRKADRWVDHVDPELVPAPVESVGPALECELHVVERADDRLG